MKKLIVLGLIVCGLMVASASPASAIIDYYNQFKPLEDRVAVLVKENNQQKIQIADLEQRIAKLESVAPPASGQSFQFAALEAKIKENRGLIDSMFGLIGAFQGLLVKILSLLM